MEGRAPVLELLVQLLRSFMYSCCCCWHHFVIACMLLSVVAVAVYNVFTFNFSSPFLKTAFGVLCDAKHNASFRLHLHIRQRVASPCDCLFFYFYIYFLFFFCCSLLLVAPTWLRVNECANICHFSQLLICGVVICFANFFILYFPSSMALPVSQDIIYLFIIYLLAVRY